METTYEHFIEIMVYNEVCIYYASHVEIQALVSWDPKKCAAQTPGFIQQMRKWTSNGAFSILHSICWLNRDCVWIIFLSPAGPSRCRQASECWLVSGSSQRTRGSVSVQTWELDRPEETCPHYDLLGNRVRLCWFWWGKTHLSFKFLKFEAAADKQASCRKGGKTQAQPEKRIYPWKFYRL